MSGRAKPSPTDGQYLIWSNDHGGWSAPKRFGYTRRLSEAGRFSRADALAACAQGMPGTARRRGVLPEIPVALDDLLAMLRGQDGSEYVPGKEPWE